MSGAAFYIDSDFDAVRKFIAQVSEPKAMFDGIGQVLLTGVKDRFQAGKAPDGSDWKISKRAQREGGKTLQDTARLLNSMTYNASETEVEVGSNVVYAAIHQFGGEAKNIEARPFLGISALEANLIDQVVMDFVNEAAA